MTVATNDTEWIAWFAGECVRRGLSKQQAKSELERVGRGDLRSQLSPAMRAITGEPKPAPTSAQRRAAERLRTARIVTHEDMAAMDEAMQAVHDALLAVGATLETESDSGSRYYRLAGGGVVRVSDHDATEATQEWLDREEGEQIRVDRRSWRSALNQIVSQ